MSDTNFDIVQLRLRKLEFNKDTEDWIQSSLSDDEISLPKENVGDEMDEDLADLAEELSQVEAEEKWDDLGLEKFNKESSSN